MSSQSQIQRSALNSFTNTMKTGYPLPKKSHRTCINYYVLHTLNISSTITQLVKLECPLFTLPSNKMFPFLMVSGFKSHSLTLAPACWWNSREILSNPAASRDDSSDRLNQKAVWLLQTVPICSLLYCLFCTQH